MVDEVKEQPDFDLEDVMKDLIAFRSNVSFHLTTEKPLPTKFEAPLWQAYHLVADVIEELTAMYKYEERGLTYFKPTVSGEEPEPGR
ncbi:hypothetical protein C3941_20850 [Kaistia algarum]|uniref:hypothetical protein n=1 Tax=Kaistia algarum TaxID=2083279 RepID=UPI000CE76511|nr:hypothetical protein [Kaistia algarum]MCX5516063.1 hypothetical protein [Kaistia algarum]PPE77988.1 hypothetical protein C3941_20850 [Kaistia algarum]